MIAATLIREVLPARTGIHQLLWRTSQALTYTRRSSHLGIDPATGNDRTETLTSGYFITSRANFVSGIRRVREVRLYASTERGVILSSIPLHIDVGSLSHKQAVLNAGFSIHPESPAPPP